MAHASNWKLLGARLRVPTLCMGLALGALSVAACGTSGPAAAPTKTGSGSAAPAGSAAASSSGSCTGVAGAHHARVVVEASAGKVVERCVGFSSTGEPALTLLQKSHLELGTQKFSFGVAICQVDHVPAHYTKCLPTGADYWALFVSKNGRTWTSPSVGVSDITVPSGGSLGLRYDSPNGTPAAPPHPTPA